MLEVDAVKKGHLRVVWLLKVTENQDCGLLRALWVSETSILVNVNRIRHKVNRIRAASKKVHLLLSRSDDTEENIIYSQRFVGQKIE